MTTPNRKPHAPRHHPQWWTMERVQKMHARYVAGATFTEIAREYDVRPSSVRQAFVRRKLTLIPRPNFGRFARTYKLKTAAEVAAILARQTRLSQESWPTTGGTGRCQGAVPSCGSYVQS